MCVSGGVWIMVVCGLFVFSSQPAAANLIRWSPDPLSPLPVTCVHLCAMSVMGLILSSWTHTQTTPSMQRQTHKTLDRRKIR